MRFFCFINYGEFKMKTRILSFSIAFIFAAGSALAQAVNYYWTGAEDNFYTNANNWVTGSPSGPVSTIVPPSTDYEAALFFSDTAQPLNKNITFAGNRDVNALNFESPDWTLGFGIGKTKSVKCVGGGTNVVVGKISTANYSATWTIAAGSTLVCNSIETDAQQYLTLDGGGTLVAKTGPIKPSWVSSTVKTQVVIKELLLRIEIASPIDNGALVNLAAPSARFQYKNTPGNAKSRFGITIFNTYGRGSTLIARDIGDGYVEVSLASPATHIIIQ